MTGNADTRTGQNLLEVIRRTVGGLVVVATVLAVVCYALAVWNPWQLVVLDRYFGNPLFGVMVVGVGAYLSLWLLKPIRNETVQLAGLRARVVATVLAVVGLIAWGMFGRVFLYEYDELATTDDRSRTVALVTKVTDDRQHVRVWQGAGLLARDVGDAGSACGFVKARFLTADLVEIEAEYDPWQIELDPETGAPLQRLGPRCPDPPAPIE